jgi:hypothetical protein
MSLHPEGKTFHPECARFHPERASFHPERKTFHQRVASGRARDGAHSVARPLSYMECGDSSSLSKGATSRDDQSGNKLPHSKTIRGSNPTVVLYGVRRLALQNNPSQ